MPSTPRQPITILMAEDDPDDRLLTQEAFAECRLGNPLRFAVDGEQLMDYLLRNSPFEDPVEYPMPGLILLDLNMPRKDGREALREIKEHPDLRKIPVVILTTSKAEEDVVASYRDGANSFITKPVSFASLIDVVQALGNYWLQIVDLPAEPAGGEA